MLIVAAIFLFQALQQAIYVIIRCHLNHRQQAAQKYHFSKTWHTHRHQVDTGNQPLPGERATRKMLDLQAENQITIDKRNDKMPSFKLHEFYESTHRNTLRHFLVQRFFQLQ